MRSCSRPLCADAYAWPTLGKLKLPSLQSFNVSRRNSKKQSYKKRYLLIALITTAELTPVTFSTWDCTRKLAPRGGGGYESSWIGRWRLSEAVAEESRGLEGSVLTQSNRCLAKHTLHNYRNMLASDITQILAVRTTYHFGITPISGFKTTPKTDRTCSDHGPQHNPTSGRV